MLGSSDNAFLYIATASFVLPRSRRFEARLAQSIPEGGQGEGFTSYTWHDHPFVLRVVFGRNVAALGSINSSASIFRPLPANVDIDDDTTMTPLHDEFSEMALLALNNLIAAVRRKAPLYHILDLRRFCSRAR